MTLQMIFFFFSSRRRHTRLQGDWSSDVCSSDLKPRYDEHHVHVHESPNSMLAPLMILAVLSIVGGWFAAPAFLPGGTDYFARFLQPVFAGVEVAGAEAGARSEERRVGKEGRSRWSPYH